MCIRDSIPSKTKSFFSHNPWFNRACSLAIQARDSAYRVWKNSRSPITLAIFIQLEIIAGILFDEQSLLSSKESALTSLVLILTNLSSLATSVNLLFLLLFDLIIVLLILLLKRLISSAPRSTIFSMSQY